MAPRSKKDMKPATGSGMETRTRNAKRKLSNNEEDGRLVKVIKVIRAERGLSRAASLENVGGSPPRDSTSETSGLTSADEAVPGSSATGVDTDGSKHLSESRGFSVEGNRTAEIVTAYRNAMEILVEITNRDRYRAYSQPYAGFGGPIPYAAPYMNGPVGPYTTPYANALPNTYTTPYANPTQASYVTPYSNPPVVAGPSGSSQSKAVVEPKSDGISRPIMSLGSSQERVVETNADLSSGVLEERDDEFEGTPKADDEVSTMDIDSFLALANGGVPIGQNDDSIDSDIDDDNHIINRTALDAPPSPADTIDESRSRADEDVQALVNHIAKGLMLSEEPPNQAPAGNPYAAFYSTMDGKQLGAELKRLVAVAHPEVNAIMARDQIHAAHLFYTHLVSRASTQNTPIFPPPQVHNHAHFPPANHWGHAALPPSPPKGYMVQWHDSVTGAPIPSPPQQPAQNPAQPFLLRSNATAPPVVRNVSVSEEQKVATYGFPPKPERRPGLRSGGQKGKRKI